MNENIESLVQIEADLKKIYSKIYSAHVTDPCTIATINNLNSLADTIYDALSDNDKQVVDSMGY